MKKAGVVLGQGSPTSKGFGSNDENSWHNGERRRVEQERYRSGFSKSLARSPRLFPANRFLTAIETRKRLFGCLFLAGYSSQCDECQVSQITVVPYSD